MMEMNGNEKEDALRKLLLKIQKDNLMNGIFLYESNKDDFSWMEYVMNVFKKEQILTIENLVKRSHKLVDKIANDALKIIMKYALILHERNVREEARKVAFKETDIPFEILSEASSQFVFINKQRAYRTFTVMKKKKKMQSTKKSEKKEANHGETDNKQTQTEDAKKAKIQDKKKQTKQDKKTKQSKTRSLLL